MQEREKQLIRDSFSSVKVYLTHSEELENKIKSLEEESENLSEFIQKLEDLSSSTEDPTERTDQRIFLNNLRDRSP